jgi:hypothetical protein
MHTLILPEIMDELGFNPRDGHGFDLADRSAEGQLLVEEIAARAPPLT